MKLLLHMYDHSVAMHVKFHQGVIVIEELLLFDCLHFKDFFNPQP